MIDYITFQAGTEYPTLSGVMYTVLLSFLLSTSIAVVYVWTTPRQGRPKDFFQALVLAAVVASTVMQAIGDSLAVGLGMLGALAIIRFRTNLENPRDIIFMFASLAAGLACGVYGFTISLVGTVMFCLVALALKTSSFSAPKDYPARIRFRLPKNSEDLAMVENILRQHCKKVRLDLIRERQDSDDPGEAEGAEKSIPVTLINVEYSFRATFKNEASYQAVIPSLQRIPGLTDLRINLQNPR